MADDDRNATDYAIDPAIAKELLGVVLLPHEFRLKSLQRLRRQIGHDGMLDLFAQFIGLANSVVANSHDALQLLLICEKSWDPLQAERLNFPTIFGALNGVALASGVPQAKLCHGCACRLGSLANQSPATTCSVEWCLGEDDRFYCHEDLDAAGRPTKPCIGFQARRKALGLDRVPMESEVADGPE